MKTFNKKPLWMNTGHRKPVTRREFLASGVIPFSAALLAPNFINLILGGGEALAQTAPVCPTPAGSLIPMVTVNLSGGAGLAGNFIPTDTGRQLLTSYTKVGLGLGSRLPVVREFGNVPFAGTLNGRLISQFLQGIRDTATTAISKTAFVGMPVRTRDDSGENPQSIDGMLLKAGLIGSSLPFLGTENTGTGINQKSAVVSAQAPLIVRSFNDISNSLGYAASLGKNLSKKQQGVLATFISKLSQTQSRKLASMTNGEQIKTLVDCAGIKNGALLSGTAAAVDPRANTGVSQVWNINANSQADNENMIFASMAFNVLTSVTGAASIELGGYDYHDNTRTSGDQKDLEAGQLVGRLLQTAEVLQKSIFIYVCSDGAVTSDEGNDPGSVWSSDRGTAGVSYMLYYNPVGRAATTDFQIGQFTSEQVSDDKFITGANPEAAAAAVFANYMKLNNKMDVFDQIAGRLIDRTLVNSVVKF